jgi:hypothetical protein
VNFQMTMLRSKSAPRRTTPAFSGRYGLAPAASTPFLFWQSVAWILATRCLLPLTCRTTASSTSRQQSSHEYLDRSASIFGDAFRAAAMNRGFRMEGIAVNKVAIAWPEFGLGCAKFFRTLKPMEPSCNIRGLDYATKLMGILRSDSLPHPATACQIQPPCSARPGMGVFVLKVSLSTASNTTAWLSGLGILSK